MTTRDYSAEVAIPEIEEGSIGGVLQELEQAYFDIPFENSDFQNRNFVMAAQITPGRGYRAIGLRMFAKIRAVKTHALNRRRLDVKLRKKKHKLEKCECPFKRELLEIDILEMEDGGTWGDKLLNDALRELSCLYHEFKKLPKYTRESFEREEAHHYHQRLTRALKAQGAHESLVNMGEDMPNWTTRIETALQDHPDLTLQLLEETTAELLKAG